MAAHKILKKMEDEALSIEDQIVKGKAKDYAEYQGLVNRARGLRDGIAIVREGVRIGDDPPD